MITVATAAADVPADRVITGSQVSWGRGGQSRVISVARMAYAAGFIIGRTLGGMVRWRRPVLLATAGCLVLQIVPLGRQRVVRYVRVRDVTGDANAAEPVPEAGPAALILFTGLTVIAMAADTIKFGYLPLYMDRNSGLSATLRGAVIGLQPLLEFCLARRPPRADAGVAIGIALGAVADVAYATSTSVWGVIVGQVLVAGNGAVSPFLGWCSHRICIRGASAPRPVCS